MSSYIVMLTNDPISFKVALQSLTAQSTREALTMKEAVFCSNMVVKVGFKERIPQRALVP